MSSLKNAVRQRTYKERAQPHARAARFGLLEKHRDYVQRARDFHRKEDRLQALREKARLRNDDEFYHGMIHARTENGVHYIQDRNNNFSGDMLKLLKSQDLNYVKLQLDTTRKQVQRLKSQLAFLGVTDTFYQNQKADTVADFQRLSNGEEEVHEDTIMCQAKEDVAAKPKHIIFVKNKKSLKSFDLAQHLQTPEAFLDRAHNRPRLNQLLQPIQTVRNVDRVVTDEYEKDQQCLEKDRKYKTLKMLMDRESQLVKVERELQTQKLLATQKGQRRKVGTDPQGNPIFKWRAERQK